LGKLVATGKRKEKKIAWKRIGMVMVVVVLYCIGAL